MSRVILVLALILLSSNTFAQEPGRTDYAACFQDGGIYAQSMCFEDNVKNYYEVLTKIDKLKGNEIEEVKYLLIRRMNANLNTLGSMIEDIEKGGVLSSQFYEYIKKEEQRMSKSFEEILGSEGYSEIVSNIDETQFWKKLKNEREMKNWKFKYKNEKMKKLMEQKIELALDTYIKYGNVFKME
jgi:hypothetical protein